MKNIGYYPFVKLKVFRREKNLCLRNMSLQTKRKWKVVELVLVHQHLGNLVGNKYGQASNTTMLMDLQTEGSGERKP